jgi:DNA-binding HxlR family transcriptional regulator
MEASEDEQFALLVLFWFEPSSCHDGNNRILNQYRKYIYLNQQGWKSIAISMDQGESSSESSEEQILPKVPFEECPIRLSLGCLGRKWALIILRDIAFLRDQTFGEILQRNSSLTPRALSIRLRDLQKEGLIERKVDPADNRKVHYRLTRQGRDVIPVLTALIQYGIRYHAGSVFQDKKPRDLESLYQGRQEFMLGRLEKFATKGAK